jgi:hypothetical protein
MLYSHSWACDPASVAYVHRWPRIVADTQRIAGHLATLGVDLAGPDGTGALSVDHDGIAFNGPGEHAGQPFTLPAPTREPGTVHRGHCATGLLPYDLAVTAVLLRCHTLLGNEFIMRSSGRWHDEWLLGVRPGQPGARQILAALFGPLPNRNPLLWLVTTEPVRAHTSAH